MSDYIVRATAGNGSIRAFAATTRDLVQHAREIHHTSPVASAALGRMLTAAAMMGSMLKGEKDIVTLQIRGEGPLQGLVVLTAEAAHFTAESEGLCIQPQCGNSGFISRQAECRRRNRQWLHERNQGYRHERALCRTD